MKHIKGLDSLRAIAVLLVIVEHWSPSINWHHSDQGSLFSMIMPNGSFGVNVFFVLSGFLISAILLKARAADTQGNITVLKNFIARRFLRIFPIYYLAIAVLIAIGFPFIREHLFYFLSYATNVLIYKQGAWNPFSHTWSLCVEEQFYLVWPVLLLFINKKYIKHVIFSFIAIGIISTFITLNVMHGFNSILVFNCFDAFGLGALFAYAQLDSSRLQRFTNTLRYALPVAVVAYFGWKVAIYTGYHARFSFLSRATDSIIALGMIQFVINNKNAWIQNNILENKALNYIGKISYGIYLYHYALDPMYNSFVHHLVSNHSSIPAIVENFYFAYVMKLAILFGVCALSYELLEKKIVSFKNLFEYNAKPSARGRRPLLQRILAGFSLSTQVA